MRLRLALALASAAALPAVALAAPAPAAQAAISCPLGYQVLYVSTSGNSNAQAVFAQETDNSAAKVEPSTWSKSGWTDILCQQYTGTSYGGHKMYEWHVRDDANYCWSTAAEQTMLLATAPCDDSHGSDPYENFWYAGTGSPEPSGPVYNEAGETQDPCLWSADANGQVLGDSNQCSSPGSTWSLFIA